MNATNQATAARGSKLKDLLVTATVASVVSALVSPWIRRVFDGSPSATGTPDSGSGSATPTESSEHFDSRVERLLDVPNPFAEASTQSHERMFNDDDE